MTRPQERDYKSHVAYSRELESYCDKLTAENLRLRDALERLARLGNGDKYGNSVGNEIAHAALGDGK